MVVSLASSLRDSSTPTSMSYGVTSRDASHRKVLMTSCHEVLRWPGESSSRFRSHLKIDYGCSVSRDAVSPTNVVPMVADFDYRLELLLRYRYCIGTKSHRAILVSRPLKE